MRSYPSVLVVKMCYSGLVPGKETGQATYRNPGYYRTWVVIGYLQLSDVFLQNSTEPEIMHGCGALGRHTTQLTVITFSLVIWRQEEEVAVWLLP